MSHIVGGAATDTSAPAPRRAPVPLAAAGASTIAVVQALCVIALGACGLREALLSTGWIRGGRWTPNVVRFIDGLTPGGWAVPVGAAASALGLLVMAVAVAPRRRYTVPLASETPAYLPHRDVATLAADRTRRVAGVLRARARASTRRIVVRCEITSDSAAGVRQDIEAAVRDELAVLRRPPRVVVRTRQRALS